MQMKTKLALRGLALAAAVGISTQVRASAILSGDLVNIRVGDGTTVPASTGLPVTLDEYQVTYGANGAPTSVSLRQSIAVSTATSGAVPTTGNRYLVQGGTAGGEGGLLLSGDGNYMSFAGYNAIVGASLNGGSANTEDRVVGLLNLNTGVIDTTTAFSGFTGGTQGAAAARGAYMDASGKVYLAASTGSRLGTSFTTNTGTGTNVGATNNGRRDVVFNGQLYQTESANSRSGIEMIGTGEPSTTGNTVTLLPGFPATTTGNSPYDFWFADSNTLYVADDTGSATGTGGLQKWVLSGGTWSMQFDHHIAGINPGGSASANGAKGLTGFFDSAGDAVMFMTTVSGTNNIMVGLLDPAGNTSASNVVENTLVNSSTLFSPTTGAFNLRGLALAGTPVDNVVVPEPTSLGLLLIGAPLIARRRRKA